MLDIKINEIVFRQEIHVSHSLINIKESFARNSVTCEPYLDPEDTAFRSAKYLTKLLE